MTGNVTYFLALSIGLGLSIVALIAVFVSPRTNSSHFYMGNTENVDKRMVKVVNLLGGDLLSLIPKDVQKRSVSSKEINDVFRESGNPWNVTKMEFLALRAAFAFMFSFAGLIFVIITQPGLGTGGIIMIAVAYLGWQRPIYQYRSIAKKRAEDFKKYSPEMFDYLTMIMKDGNYTLANAIETVIPYLPKSAVKEEFSKVIDSVNAGISIEVALNDLADRLPSPALEAFVRSVNNANQLSTPMDDLMRNMSSKMREDLLNDLELVIQVLPTKTMLTVGPASIGSMIAILLSPVIIALLETL